MNLTRLLQNGNINKAKRLIMAGVNVNKPDNNGCTPLHLASGIGRTETARFLLEAGANVNIANNYGNTPFTFGLG